VPLLRSHVELERAVLECDAARERHAFVDVEACAAEVLLEPETVGGDPAVGSKRHRGRL
jgi:hypothetical protein